MRRSNCARQIEYYRIYLFVLKISHLAALYNPENGMCCNVAYSNLIYMHLSDRHTRLQHESTVLLSIVQNNQPFKTTSNRLGCKSNREL